MKPSRKPLQKNRYVMLPKEEKKQKGSILTLRREGIDSHVFVIMLQKHNQRKKDVEGVEAPGPKKETY